MIDLDILNIDSNNKALCSISGDKVSGVRLLAQRVMVILLTSMSGLLRSSEGSDFIQEDMAPNTQIDRISMAVSSALASVKHVIGMDNGVYPLSEQLEDIRIHNIYGESGSIVIELIVYSKDGSSSIVSIPTGDVI